MLSTQMPTTKMKTSESAYLLNEVALEEITALAQQSLPNETGGVVFPELVDGSWVAEVPNHSSEPATGMWMEPDDLRTVVMKWAALTSWPDWSRLILWHSHPGGNIGPSRQDIKNRVPNVGNLVVSLDPVTREGIPTFF